MLSLKEKNKLQVLLSGASFVFVYLQALLIVLRACGTLGKVIGEVRHLMRWDLILSIGWYVAVSYIMGIVTFS